MFPRVDISSSPVRAGGRGVINLCDDVGGGKALKWPWMPAITDRLMATSSISLNTPALFFSAKKVRNAQNRGMMQLKLCGPKSYSNAPAMTDVALADFLHSHCLPFSLAEDPKLLEMI